MLASGRDHPAPAHILPKQEGANPTTCPVKHPSYNVIITNYLRNHILKILRNDFRSAS